MALVWLYDPSLAMVASKGQLGLVYRGSGHPSRVLSSIILAAFQCSNSHIRVHHCLPPPKHMQARTELSSLSFCLIFFTTTLRLMSVTPVPYSLFLSRNTLLTSRGGPWSCFGFTNQTCDNYIVPPANYQITIGSSYATAEEHGYQTMSLQTTIALNLTSLRGARDRLSFWGFLANSLSNITDSRSVSIHSSVGDYQFTDNLNTQLGVPTNITHWGDDRHFLHTGTLDVSTVDENVLIDVALNVTVFQVPQEWYNLMFRHLDLTLGLAEQTSTSEQISSTSGTLSISTNEPIKPDMTTTSEPSTFFTSTSSLSSETTVVPQKEEQSDVPTIIGGTLGGLAILLLALALMILWRRQQFKRRIGVNNISKPQAMALDEIPLEIIEVSRSEGGHAEPYSPPPAIVSHQIMRSHISAARRASKIEVYPRRVPMESPPSYMESSSPGTEGSYFSNPYGLSSPVSYLHSDRIVIE